MGTPGNTAGDVLLKEAGDLAEWITEQQYAKQPDLNERFGPSGRVRTKMDSLYTLNYLAESVLVNSPALFLHYISWLKVLLEGYKVTGEDLKVNLEAMREAVESQFHHPQKDKILDFMDMGMMQSLKTTTMDSYITDSNPLAREARDYLEFLLQGQRMKASKLIHKLMDREISIQALYKHIFQSTQYEIGRLWHTGTMNVSQEHYCTAVTQSIISSLYPHWITMGTKGLTLVAACVGSETHEIGLRMVADTFEMEGWDTYYLGANVPDSSLIHAIDEHQADVVAVSVTMTYHIHLVRDLIAKIRADQRFEHVKIMVGGLPFNLDQNLWKEVGADGYAPDAESTVAVAEQLVSSHKNKVT
ncbi:cobalamin B12-binding domain-containing protein [Paenibacillus lemnae]|uniref:Cobalamin-binding protein n=1 Tax=Paenibacillus lemnae TaxID=1330551 RepID=A0A848M319_PAELE|nr:cobalamin-dependent protein [Paenibacillus lemnae]NMO94512.1 cobalamin-binding protein [Paenibacillus lemnae]